MLKSDEKSWKKKVLGMGWPGGQNVRTPWGSVFMLSRGPPGPYTKKNQKYVEKIIILYNLYRILYIFYIKPLTPISRCWALYIV